MARHQGGLIITNAGPDGTGCGSRVATGDRTADATFLFPLQSHMSRLMTMARPEGLEPPTL